MYQAIRNISHTAILLAAILISVPVFAEEKDKHDHKEHAGHDHHEGHSGHEKEAKGTGKTDIKEISAALHENLACLDKEIAAANHDTFHSCLETIEALGLDLVALKAPVDPAKKKRVNGYAKNLGMMAHKVDEHMDGKQPEKAKSQLGKLKSQVEMILKQFPELENHDKPGTKKEAGAKKAAGHEGHGH